MHEHVFYMWFVPNVKLNVFVHAKEFIMCLFWSDMVSGFGPFPHGHYVFLSLSPWYSLPLIWVFASLDLGSQISFATVLGFCFFLRWPICVNTSSHSHFSRAYKRSSSGAGKGSKFVDICWLYFVTPIPTTSWIVFCHRLFACGLPCLNLGYIQHKSHARMLKQDYENTCNPHKTIWNY